MGGWTIPLESSEPRSKILVRRGSRLTQKSVYWGLEMAVPLGLAGLLIMDLRKRKVITDKQLVLIVKAPTYLAVARTCLGMCVYMIGRVLEC